MQLTGNSGDLLSSVQSLHDARKDWVFGHISYDYKNILEPRLTSGHPVSSGFPLLFFFIPQTVCHINREETLFSIETFDDPGSIYNAVIAAAALTEMAALPEIKFSSSISKDEYINTISKLREHIADGDCYEINFCNRGYCENVIVDPLQVFNALNEISPAPFASYYRLEDKYMMCASPERYLGKDDTKIFSQPIKGTARRDKDEATDKAIKEALRQDIKERAENVMIVDLVRNDLARSCETGTVQAEELFGIYTFPQVHQMISTVSGTLKQNIPFIDALRYSFPMGSMTGAPKYKVMQLIEAYEHSSRELYAGTVGYISPGGDFDFNVVIRSLFYNASSRLLSYHTGGAITYDSSAEREWEEMRLKAWAMEKIFIQ